MMGNVRGSKVGHKMSGKEKKKINLGLLIGIIIVVLLLVVGGMFLRLNMVQKKLAQGDEYLQAEQFDRALEAYRGASKIMSTSADAYLGMMKAYVGLGELEEAMAILEKGIDKTGSSNLEESKSIVLDQVFATYVMNFYSLNLLKGESDKLTVTNKSTDFGFDISFSGTDDSVITVSEEGDIKAIEDGEAAIIVHLGNDTWGYRDEEIPVVVGVVVTYLEQAGCEYVDSNTVLEAPGFLFQTDNDGERIYDGTLDLRQNNAKYKITGCDKSDPDADGNITYTITVDVKFLKEIGIVRDTKEEKHNWYYDWVVEPLIVGDEFTGTIFSPQDLYDSEFPVYDSEFENKGITYTISGELWSEFDNNEDWAIELDEDDITWARATVSGTYVITIVAPKQYEGLVLAVDKNGITDYTGDEAAVLSDRGFFDTLDDGSVRSAEDYIIVRVKDIM